MTDFGVGLQARVRVYLLSSSQMGVSSLKRSEAAVTMTMTGRRQITGREIIILLSISVGIS